MEYETIKLELTDGVAMLTLNRPDVLNSLNKRIMEEIRDAVATVERNDDTRVLVMTGAGRGFCAGADLTPGNDAAAGQAVSMGERAYRSLDERFNPLVRDIYNLQLPTIAAVNGVAAGAGVGLALVSDIVIAARSATFILVFAPRLGLVPDAGCTWQLPRLVGRARALGMCLLGDKLSAEMAEQWGLIWKCVDDEQLMEETVKVAERLKKGPTKAFYAVRQALDAAQNNDLHAQLDYERDAQRTRAETEDFVEGIFAFMQKREPEFKGR